MKSASESDHPQGFRCSFCGQWNLTLAAHEQHDCPNPFRAKPMHEVQFSAECAETPAKRPDEPQGEGFLCPACRGLFSSLTTYEDHECPASSRRRDPTVVSAVYLFTDAIAHFQQLAMEAGEPSGSMDPSVLFEIVQRGLKRAAEPFARCQRCDAVAHLADGVCMDCFKTKGIGQR